jgi:hypothetical protein
MPLPALLLICLIIAVLVGYIAWGIWKVAHDSKLLKERGVPTTAEVLKQSIRFVADSTDNSSSAVHELNIRYSVGGKTYENKMIVPEHVYHAHPPHSRVEIVYLPTNPKIVGVK